MFDILFASGRLRCMAKHPKAPPAKGGSLAFRIDDEEKEALSAAAEADGRTISSLARKIVADWLRAQGWIKGGGKGASQ